MVKISRMIDLRLHLVAQMVVEKDVEFQRAEGFSHKVPGNMMGISDVTAVAANEKRQATAQRLAHQGHCLFQKALGLRRVQLPGQL
jgi:plasmid rolling circle replication initiator protein Rep